MGTPMEAPRDVTVRCYSSPASGRSKAGCAESTPQTLADVNLCPGSAYHAHSDSSSVKKGQLQAGAPQPSQGWSKARFLPKHEVKFPP